MKLFVQSHKCDGATVVIANSSEEAKYYLATRTKDDKWCNYDPNKPWDFETEIGSLAIQNEITDGV